MKKFQFRLEPVLKLRKYKERMAQMELARAQAALLESQQMVESAIKREGEARHDWEAGMEKGMWEPEFRWHVDHVRGLEQQTVQTIEYEAKMQEVVAQRQGDLMKVTVSRKSMDLLKDERLNQYLLETGRQEQKETDELANLHRSSQERLES